MTPRMNRQGSEILPAGKLDYKMLAPVIFTLSLIPARRLIIGCGQLWRPFFCSMAVTDQSINSALWISRHCLAFLIT